MRILVLAEKSWYDEIVTSLRSNHTVNLLTMGRTLQFRDGTMYVPKLFGRHKGFVLLAGLITHVLLFGKHYDCCISDYRSQYLPFLALWARKLSLLRRTVFVNDIRTIPVGYEDTAAEAIESAFQRRLQFVMGAYHAITFITEELRRYTQAHIVNITLPSAVWESGVDERSFVPRLPDKRLKASLGLGPADFVCFYHGSIERKRGVKELVRAFEIVRLRSPEIRLLILGNSESLRGLIRELKLDDIVLTHKWVPPSEVPDIVALADLCVIPLPDIVWWRVSSPLKLMEYIAAGKRILLTRMLAHTSVVGHTENYFWVDHPTPEKLATAILEAAEHFRSNPTDFVNRGIEERCRLLPYITWDSQATKLSSFLMSLREPLDYREA